jgi:TolB-like protein
MLLLGIGFFFALFFAWAFELTPEGIKREAEVDRTQSITPKTGRKLDFTIIGFMAVALAWFALDKFGSDEQPTPAATETNTAETTSSDGASAPSAKSVAVLPFLALTSGADDEYFADGLTEEILNSLAQLPELLVTARTSAFQFKGDNIPPLSEIAATLGVEHIVEGSIRKAGNRLRVTAQLIRASDGFHLWSKNYDSTSEDSIQVQEDIAEKIAAAMDVVLDDRRRELMRNVGLRDVEAFIAYQKGMELYDKAHGDMDQIGGLRLANEQFDKVIERVPTYAEAYLRRSDLYTHMLLGQPISQNLGSATEEEIARSLDNAVANFQAAIEYAPSPELRDNAEFDLAVLTGNWRGLGIAIERYIARPGCDETIWMQPIATVFGFTEHHKDKLREVRQCDPLRSGNWQEEARNLYWNGEAEAALEIAKQGMEVAPGAWLTTARVRAHVILGQYEEAEAIIDSHFQNIEDVLMNKSLTAAARGDYSEALKVIEQYTNHPRTGTHDTDFYLMNMHTRIGNRDEVNRMAAAIDQSEVGYFTLVLQAYWCACGAPWDLEYTPNFAAKLEESSLPWPPAPIIHFPLKNW